MELFSEVEADAETDTGDTLPKFRIGLYDAMLSLVLDREVFPLGDRLAFKQVRHGSDRLVFVMGRDPNGNILIPLSKQPWGDKFSRVTFSREALLKFPRFKLAEATLAVNGDDLCFEVLKSAMRPPTPRKMHSTDMKVSRARPRGPYNKAETITPSSMVKMPVLKYPGKAPEPVPNGKISLDELAKAVDVINRARAIMGTNLVLSDKDNRLSFLLAG